MTTASASAELTDGFHLLVDALKLNDVDTIYGLVGIPITDLARVAQNSGIRFVGFRHETSAGNAAAAAGFLTQRPGVCLTVSGPGFLNGLVALANATTNCFPMIHIAGSSDRPIVDLQRGDYEELDQLAAARPFAKAAYRIARVEDIGIGVARAIRSAVSGRPGGVYLDIPGAVLAEAIDARAAADTIWRVVDPAPRQSPAPDAVDRALDLLAQAQRPLIVLGKGAAYAKADKAIRAFVESTGIPFLPMSMAKGLLPDSHPQSVAAARSLALSRADVVLLVGARLNWLLSHGQSPPWSATRGSFRPTSRHRNSTATGRSLRHWPATSTRSCQRCSTVRRPGRSSRRPTGPPSSASARRTTRPRCANCWPTIRTRCGSSTPCAPFATCWPNIRRCTWSTRAPTPWTSPATSSTWKFRGTGSTAEPGG